MYNLQLDASNPEHVAAAFQLAMRDFWQRGFKTSYAMLYFYRTPTFVFSARQYELVGDAKRKAEQIRKDVRRCFSS